MSAVATTLSMLPDETGDPTTDTLAAIGGRIREMRQARGWTLQSLAEATNLSPGMLSLVERGRASPSIGSLIIIASALGATMSDLLASGAATNDSIVVRGHESQVVETPQHVVRRLLRDDRTRDLTVAVNEYEPSTGSFEVPITYEGFEYGYILEGVLSVEVDGTEYSLGPGDLISYSSRRPHRIWNHSDSKARTLWINLKRD